MSRFSATKSKQNTLCTLLALLGGVMIVLGLLMVFQPAAVLANNNDMSYLTSEYPHIVGTALDDCDICHEATRPQVILTGYGADYFAEGGSSRSRADLVAIETVDSDGDGYLNIIEIEAMTSPADGSEYPHDDALARYSYPNIVGERLDSCLLCHTAEKPTSAAHALNTYGDAYLDEGRDLAAFDTIASDDSDGDTFSNITEINELTFPGDQNDHPVQVNEDMDRARTRYPDIVDERLDSCLLCHTAEEPTGADHTLNAYGDAYLDEGRDLAAFDDIADSDSDNDVFSNIEEITGLTFPGDPADSPHDNFLVLKKYPELEDSRLDDCIFCHTDGNPTDLAYALNAYGTAYNSEGRNLAAFGAIENIDSDVDTFTNLEEINDFKFPGDPDDFPVAATNDMALAVEKYPHIESTDLNACILCHTGNNPTNNDHPLNSYGTAYDSAGRNLDAFDDIAGTDSDNDEFTNLEEITQLFFPGDPTDPHDDARVRKQYNYLAGTRVDTCTLCHKSDDFTLNPYGCAYKNAGRNLAALVDIEENDSDNDDFTNLEEIQSDPPTFPGDADDPHDDARVRKQYGYLIGTDLDSCDLCHSSVPYLNFYGTAYNDAGRNLAALIDIEDGDADEDAYTNLEEIEALTFPGDPFDYPTHARYLYLLQYPELAGTRLADCLLCHISLDGVLNPYGDDFKNAGNNEAAFSAIENWDSDDDGYLNIEEIEALTFPGDPADTPAQNSGSNMVFLPIILK